MKWAAVPVYIPGRGIRSLIVRLDWQAVNEQGGHCSIKYIMSVPLSDTAIVGCADLRRICCLPFTLPAITQWNVNYE